MPTATNRCTGCKERFKAETMIRINAGKFHSVDCATGYATAKSAKAKAKQIAKAKREKAAKEKAQRAQTRADKERLRKRADWYKILEPLVNQYVLHVRDKNEPCCTCGKTSHSVKYDAGHYLSVGAHGSLRFELTNIHKQCSVNCNQHGSGMRAEYNEFIKAKYGQEHYEWLNGPHPTLKETFPHYEDIKAEIERYRKLIRSHGLKPNR